jgi:hypothetical protein
MIFLCVCETVWSPTRTLRLARSLRALPVVVCPDCIRAAEAPKELYR